jgi:flagellar operon protein
MDDQIRIRNSYSDATNVSQASQSNKDAQGDSFQQYLEQASSIRFSNHAQRRMEARSIDLDQEKITRLENAVEKANAHGSKESLILLDELAFIVNVRDRTVVTTMDMSNNKNGVFTQIDSVVIADGTQA